MNEIDFCETFAELPAQAQEDLSNWFNAEPDDEDQKKLANLYNAGRFHAWNCPDCGERCYWGDPEDWGSFQGVCQLDFTSYPGKTERYSQWLICRQCDDCRMGFQPFEELELVGKGEPSCW